MTERSVSDWQIERYLLGELPAAERDVVSRELAVDEALARRMRDLESSNREVLALHPPRVAGAIIRERSRVDRSKPWQRSLLAVAASLAVLGAGLALWRSPEPADGNRIKGLRPSLLVFRQTPLGEEVLADHEVARQGDVVQVTYQAAGRRFGVIVSIDGRGAVTVHHPAGGDRAARLVSGTPVRLANAYQLDDAPGWERFVLVTSDRMFDVDTVVLAARRLGTDLGADSLRLPLPADLDQWSFTLTKEERR